MKKKKEKGRKYYKSERFITLSKVAPNSNICIIERNFVNIDELDANEGDTND